MEFFFAGFGEARGEIHDPVGEIVEAGTHCGELGVEFAVGGTNLFFCQGARRRRWIDGRDGRRKCRLLCVVKRSALVQRFDFFCMRLGREERG